MPIPSPPPSLFSSFQNMRLLPYNNEINETGRWYISTKRRHFKNNTFRGKRQRNFRSVISLLGLFVRFECEILNSVYQIKEVFSFQMIRKNALCSVHCKDALPDDGEWVKLCRNISLQHFSWNIYLICESDISEKNLVIITSSGGWNNLQDGNVQNLFHLYYCIYSIHVERQHIDTATATYKKHASVLNFRFNRSSFYNKDDTSHFSNF